MNNSYEQEIDLKDLLFYIVKRWRSIFLVAVIFAILIGGYKLSKGVLKSQDEQYRINLLESYNSNLKNYQKTKEGYVKKIYTLTKDIDYEEEYEKNSVLFQLDPYNKWVAKTDIFVKIDRENDVNNFVDPADSLVKAYTAIIKSDSSLEEACKENNIDIRYLRELINVEADYNGNMISVTVTYKDGEGAQQILDKILESVKASRKEVESNLRTHSIIFMNGETSMVADQTFAKRKKERIDSLTELQKNLEETQLALDDLKEPQTPIDMSFKGVIKSTFKYCVMGGAFGIFLSGLFLCVIYVIDPKLRSSDEFISRFGIKILGEYPKEEKKRKFSGIDKWLNKIEGKETFSREYVLKRVIASISIYTEKDQTVLLTGTTELDLLKNVENEIKDNFNKLNLEMGADMNRTPETLIRLRDIDSIILVEKCGVSKYKDIERQIETIYSLNKKIIGCIIL